MLTGNFAGYMECYIEGDFLSIWLDCDCCNCCNCYIFRVNDLEVSFDIPL